MKPERKKLSIAFPELKEKLLEEDTDEAISELIDSINKVKEIANKAVFLAEEIGKMIPEVIDGYTPVKGVDYFDGKDYVLTADDKLEIAKTIEVPIVNKVIEKTLIRETPIVTEITNEITPEDIVEKLNSLNKSINVSVINGAVTQDDLALQKQTILDGMKEVDGRIKLIDQRWRGAGLSTVSHDETLTGNGTPSNPLSVASSESGFVPYVGATSNVDLGTHSLTALSFIKSGGTSSQFLKADGSVDSTSYGTGSVTSVATDSTLSGGTITTTGTLSLNLANANTWTGQQTLVATSDSTVAGISKGFSSTQTADLWQYQNSAGTAQAKFNMQGALTSRGHTFTIDTSAPTNPTAVLAGAGSGNVDNGTHYYFYTYYNSYGESFPSSTSAVSVNVVDKTTNGKVTVTVSNSTRKDVIGKRIYRSAVSGSFTGINRGYLVGTISDNTTTSFTDNVADSTSNATTNNFIIFNSQNPTYYPTWDSSFIAGAYRPMSFDNQGNTYFYNQNNFSYAFFEASSGKLRLGNSLKLKDIIVGGQASIYVTTDPANTSVDALFIAPPGGATRIYLGDASNVAYSLNMANIQRIESFPATVAWSAANDTALLGAYDTSNTISGLLGAGASAWFITYPGNFTNSFSGNRSATAARSLPWTINPTDGDGYVRVAGYIFNHENTSYSVKTSFTGSGLNNGIVPNTLAGTIGADTSGAGHTYDVKITTTGTPDKFQYSIDGGAYNGVDVSITGASQIIANGVTIIFSTTTGHTIGDITRITTYFSTKPHTRWSRGNDTTPIMDLLLTGALESTLKSAAAVGYKVTGFTGQTGNYYEVRDISNNLLTSIDSTGNVKMNVAGQGLYVKEGTNATVGQATLTAGTVVVSTTKVTANSRIFLTGEGGNITNLGSYSVAARTAGTSFTITSSNILDTNTVAWFIVEPA